MAATDDTVTQGVVELKSAQKYQARARTHVAPLTRPVLRQEEDVLHPHHRRHCRRRAHHRACREAQVITRAAALLP